MSAAARYGRAFLRTILQAALLLLLPLLPQSAAAQAPGVDGWTPPVQISNANEVAWFGDMEADGAGKLHVVWSSSDDAYDLTIYTQSVDGRSWSKPLDVVAMPLGPNGESYVSRPSLSISADGQMLMGHHGPADTTFLFNTAHDVAMSPRSWVSEELPEFGYHLQPYFGDDGVQHLLMTEFRIGPACGLCLALTHRQRDSLDGIWSDTFDVSQNPARGAAKPTMLLDGERLFLAWESGLDGNRGYVADPAAVLFTTSTDNGRTWLRPIMLDSSSAAPTPVPNAGTAAAPVASMTRNVGLGMDGSGALVAAWWRTPENVMAFRYSLDGGINWSDPQTIPGVWGVGSRSITRQDHFVMATDSAGGLHMIAVASRAPDLQELSLMHFRWEGTAWSQPVPIVSSRTDLYEWPDAEIRLGNELHVIYHVRPNALVDENDQGTFATMHTMRMLDAPAVAPVALLVSPPVLAPEPPTPLPTPLPPATATPPPEPYVAEEEVDSGLPMNIRSENDEVLTVVLAVLPVAALMLILVTVLFRRSRPKM